MIFTHYVHSWTQLATNPQQQDSYLTDDEKKDTQTFTQDSDSTGSLDSAGIAAPTHTVLTESRD